MLDEVETWHKRAVHRRFIVTLLLLMVLLNFAVRYPVDHAIPQGSDTFVLLGMSRDLSDAGMARWTLSPLSYFGLFPLSYPGGLPFTMADAQMLTGIDWNAVPLVVCLFYTLFMILVGFMFFRLFRLRDDLAALMSGLMTFSPVFIYFTYEQASGRGFLVPMFVLLVYLVFWRVGNPLARLIMFSMLLFGAFSFHRSSFMVILIISLAAFLVLVGQVFPRVKPRVKMAGFAAALALGLALFLWPYVPWLNDFLRGFPEILLSYRFGEWEFRTGFLFEGDSLSILVGNLAANYVGGMGLGLLILPIGLVGIYPTSRDTRERDVFVLLVIVMLAPLLWKAQYLQLMLLPFFYLIIGLAIQRRRRIHGVIMRASKGIPKRINLSVRLPRHTGDLAFAVFISACLVFSTGLFIHRANMTEPNTGNRNWPTDSEVNLGLYVGAFDGGSRQAFVTASDLLDRRVQWISGWSCPVIDSVTLQSNGYLDASRDDFNISQEVDNQLMFLFSFYNFKEYYVLSQSIPNRTLYDLSYTDVYGIYRLYYLSPTTAYSIPRVSTNQAGISLVVLVNSMGNSIYNLYLGEGTIKSAFLAEVSSKAYTVYASDAHTAYLAANPG